eukprot:TRINITY_DN8420_c0_g1_i1.p1 TRINITY_DN8420_c0_g1~~TRINITY_DN8420_c0_g1_i1.p1  ORF type:complete len:322 (+),score=18.42 TRINITY_DN8420_c0_g1_i1:98-1063(+)
MSLIFVESLDKTLKLAARTWQFQDINTTEDRVHLLFTHATGFCKETWEPVIDDLRSREVRFPCTTMDLRGHGDSVVNNGEPPFKFRWSHFGEDVLAVTDHIRSTYDEKERKNLKIIGIGLSKGAASLAFAEILRPGTFPAMFLIEPILSDNEERFGLGTGDDNPLAQQAERRKKYFDSYDAARDYYLKKQTMKRWNPRALDAYVRGSLKPSKDPKKGALELKCHPFAEAATYRALGDNFIEPWKKLPGIKSDVVCVGGDESEMYNIDRLQKLCRHLKSARSTEALLIPGTSHFVPLEKPDAVAREIIKFLSKLGLMKAAKL